MRVKEARVKRSGQMMAKLGIVMMAVWAGVVWVGFARFASELPLETPVFIIRVPLGFVSSLDRLTRHPHRPEDLINDA